MIILKKIKTPFAFAFFNVLLVKQAELLWSKQHKQRQLYLQELSYQHHTIKRARFLLAVDILYSQSYSDFFNQ